MDLQLTGKRALVTGGSRGIGLRIARALLAEGAHVAIAARDTERLAKAAAELSALGHPGRIVTVRIDTGDDESVRAATQSARDQLGGIDILINNAAVPGGGKGGPASPSQTTDQEFVDAVNVKVVGYLRTARAVVPGMIAQGWGRIVNISGLAARHSGNFVATARNIGVAALTKNLADELGRHGINVTVVHPGATVTERTPQLTADAAESWGVTPEEAERRLAANTAIGRAVTAEEVADVVTFLASPRSVAITGDAVTVGGGVVGAIHY
ncbi:SDR family NAD(P)-dependent oxidoreductase [Actinoplanes regularis]|uniref:NADP-dependent 3-hydroxy acid dehydrogenase YdfG n=1 Tax=Actinoplanes regularis TaxID=52697 RepID=A0A238Z292_9ACTN|nr:SDR family NAD(P)-dependent oxidoreductase [Actinoplanes regularis]GIE85751.1 short-chain dehydrogenase [Actinoplanes regularis]SNR77382.1 NADP-dependent 3-hydroxy acid dehydrogenase YdfG [Actinoplanes regularis]